MINRPKINTELKAVRLPLELLKAALSVADKNKVNGLTPDSFSGLVRQGLEANGAVKRAKQLNDILS